MSHLLFQDGQFYRDDKQVVGASNRGLRYGDGVFETMKVNAELVQLGDHHMERLFSALNLLQFEIPVQVNPAYFLDHIIQLAHRNGQGALARVRLMVFRGNGGLYDQDSNYPHHIIQTSALPKANHHLNENGLVIGIHRKALKQVDVLSNCKTNNYLCFVMGALDAKKEKWNDAIMLNSAGRICESTIANIFLVKQGIIQTPKLEEGPVAGIMRRHLLEEMAKAGVTVLESIITEEQLMEADEIFLTNSTYGIRWVGKLGKRSFTKKIATELYYQIIAPLFK